MAGRDRIAAVKRARERQARVETAAVRVAKAQRKIDQATARRERALDVADARLQETKDEYASEVDALVHTCSSITYTADVLGLSEREVRSVIRRARQSAQKANTRGGGDGD